MIRVLALAVLLVSAFPALAHEPFGWREMAPAASPPGRSAHAMAFDADRGRMVLFGGLADSGALLGDTWEWDGAEWIDVGPASGPESPEPRRSHAMAFDETIGRVVLFGGLTAAGPAADTWLWDGAAWERVDTGAATPPARSSHATVFDPIRRLIVLAGGSSNGGSLLGDTWEWRGATRAWTLACEGCVGIEDAGAYFDHRAGRVALVGGRLAGGALSEDGRLYDGVAWEVCTKVLPGRAGSVATYDPRREIAAHFGGTAPADTLSTVTTCSEWEAIEDDGCPDPPPRTGHVLALDSARGESVLFGGVAGGTALADTWILGRDACAARAGYVGTLGGEPPFDVVSVNGTVGDECREVEVAAGEPATIQIATPPSRESGRAQFALWILDGEPLPCEAGPLSFRAHDGLVRSLGEATRPLPIANTVAAGSVACAAAFPRGWTSRSLGPAWADPICVRPHSDIGRTPLFLEVTFPEGEYTIGVLVQDDASPLSPEKNVAIANWIVVHAE